MDVNIMDTALSKTSVSPPTMRSRGPGSNRSREPCSEWQTPVAVSVSTVTGGSTRGSPVVPGSAFTWMASL